ncbi:hypothetical protein NMY22_g18916 [Coprinellus aureogranulatus]|nr:hypothetical protein NMY22_g18916 [Coprinellus aureogranulatus]
MPANYEHIGFEELVNVLHPVTLIWHQLPNNYYVPESPPILEIVDYLELLFDCHCIEHFNNVARYMWDIPDTPTGKIYVGVVTPNLPTDDTHQHAPHDSDNDNMHPMAGACAPQPSFLLLLRQFRDPQEHKSRSKRKRSPSSSSPSGSESDGGRPGPSADTLDRKRQRAKAKAKAQSPTPAHDFDIDMDEAQAEIQAKLAAAGQLVEDGKPTNPNVYNHEVADFMDSVLRQLQDFAKGMSNVSPVEFLGLVYTRHPTS